MKTVKFETEANQEQHSQASFNSAFLSACKNGNLHDLDQLVELAPNHVSLMIKEYGYRAFLEVAAAGHLLVLNRLVELAYDRVLLRMEIGDYSAFHSAARGGHLLVLDRLVELSPTHVLPMIKADDYAVFKMAASGGHLLVLNRLVKLAPAHVLWMIEADGYAAFQCAVRDGCLLVLNRLLELAPAYVVIRMIEAGCYTAFTMAAGGGHLPVLNRLVELVPAYVAIQMIQADDYNAFRMAASRGHLPVLDRVMELAHDLVSLMIEADRYAAFQVAAGGGHLSVLNRLVELAPDRVSQMIKAGDYHAFKMAASRGHLPVLDQLVELAPELVSQMIAANGYEAFQGAVGGGHLPVLNRLVELAPNWVSLMIKAKNHAAFQVAAGGGHLSVLNRLVELAPNWVSRMIKAKNYNAFKMAASSGCLPVINRLVEFAPTQVLQMIEAGSYTAFQGAARGWYWAVLNRLMELAPDRVSLMIAANDYAAFSSLAFHRRDGIVNCALLDPGAFAHAERHQYEYGEHYVNPFIRNALTALRALKTTFELENPNAVFNIIDETQATRCFYMIRNLIRRNQPDLLDDMRFLLAIPAVQALAHTPVTNNEPNELLRLALTTGNEGAAAVLLAIPAVNAVAEQHQFYHHEARGAFDLEALARDRESSVRALCASEQQRLQAATSRYDPMIKAAGVEHIMSALRQTLRTRYAEDPARIPCGKDEWINLPHDWDAFQHLDLTKQQRSDALKAYHKHKDHSAWRYLLIPNPWMAKDALYVKVNHSNRLKKWSEFEGYKPLISMLYLAATDHGIPPTNGYTLETRLSHFFDELAHIGRAHNWDKTRKNARGVSEQYDDLEGDRPSCFSGAKLRLFQSVQGHPLFEMLTLEGVKLELRGFMRQHFKARITPDNLAELMGAWDKLCEEGESGVCFTALNVSEADQHVFLQRMKAKYALQFTSDPSFEQHIKTSFDLTEVFPSHVVRFAGEASLGDLLFNKRKRSHLGESSQRDAKKPNKATLEGLAACGTFSATAREPQNSPAGPLSEKLESSAASWASFPSSKKNLV